jgi:hypothetical protein
LKHLAILGASGHGKVLADTALQLGWIEVSFFDDNWPVLKLNSHWDVVGDTNKLLLELENFDGVIVAIGNNTVRLNKSKQLISESAKLITLIHPSATVSPFSSIGDGSFIGAGAILQVDCNIGLACIINTNAVI